MVPFHGRPLIDYQIEILQRCGIADIVIVKGYKQERFVRPDARTILNSKYASTNMVYSLFCAESEMNENLIISYGDIYYNEKNLMALISDPADIAITIDKRWRELWQRRMDNPLADAETLKIDKEGYITELGKKPHSYAEIQGQYMGLIKINLTKIDEIIKFYHSLDTSRIYDGKTFENMYMTTFLQELINAGMRIRGVPVYGGWLEIDTLSDLNLPEGGI